MLPDALVSELRACGAAPLGPLGRLLCWDSPRTLALLGGALACSALAAVAEALLLRGIWQLGGYLVLHYQRLAALLALLAFALCGLLLELFIGGALRRLGTRLELRLRAGLLEKLPRLHDRYLRSRTTWDLASRAHALHLLREAPALGAQLARAGFALCATAAGLLWLHPGGAPWLAAGLLLALALPWLAHRPLADRAMRLRSQTAALDRLYLDALLGATAVRVHGGERAVQREHEDLLVDWSGAASALHAQSAGAQALQLAASTLCALGLAASYLHAGREPSGLLLLGFWSLRMGAAAQEGVSALSSVHDLRGVALRLLSPLTAPDAGNAPGEPPHGVAAPDAVDAPGEPPHGVAAQIGRPAAAAIALRGVLVRAGGRAILGPISLEIPAGAHVALVGASGAGKSSLFGLLLGWLEPAQGELELDGEPLRGPALERLRAQTAWVDPAVALWDRSLFENVRFGARDEVHEALPCALERADLLDTIDQLPDGLRTELGEGGARLSGGQAQRVRLARALLRPQARLVLLDEAFRGLDRERRRELLARARRHWAGATLLFASHDVADTEGFDRVLVLEGGRLIEDDRPAALLATPGSAYRRLVQADRELRPHTWWAPGWRRARIEDGRLALADAP